MCKEFRQSLRRPAADAIGIKVRAPNGRLLAQQNLKIFATHLAWRVVKYIQKVFLVGYLSIVSLFFVCGLGLVVLASIETWNALNPGTGLSVRERFELILETVGLLTIAVASLELGQTVLEEEVQRSVNISAPTRVRRFLSRFLIVVVVSLSIECLIAVFQFMHGKPEYLLHAAAIGVAAAAILVTWGLFVRMNVDAEKLEPDSMHEVQAEDKELEK